MDARDPCGLSAFLCVVPLLGNVVRLTVNISLCFLLFIYAFFIDLFSFIKKRDQKLKKINGDKISVMM